MLRLPMIVLCITALVSVAQAADMVVIHSNAIELFPRGQLLDSHTPINLPAEAKITVVFSSGGVQTISGPYQGTLQDPLKNNNMADGSLVTALANFLIERETVRGLSQQPENIWLIDVSTYKRYYCVAPSKRAMLWRPESQSYKASTLLIKRETTGQQAAVGWPVFIRTLAWPSKLPLIYGESYTVELRTPSHTFEKELILYQLPKRLPTNSHKVVWMVSRGCIPQANMLLASLR
ncbi:MAG: hypothetical protein ABFS56_23505 [Pseudomonadota bacterium]